MSKVLVTGGAGFIGSHLVDLLVEKNYEVIVLDNLSTGKKGNIPELVKFYKEDICNPEIEEIFKNEKPDFVIHQAAQASVNNSIKNPGFDAKVNILGSLNLLECCRKFNVKKVVYASSVGIYGNPEYLPVDETHPIKPLSPYGVSKYITELYLRTYLLNYGLDYIALRYSNVYGPRQDPFGEAGVVSIFTERLLQEKTSVINGDGEQTRDFVFVEDVAKANLLALERNSQKREINLATGNETSVNELYRKLKEITSSKVEAIHGDPLPGEIRNISLKIDLAQKYLGWNPETDLDQGLRKTVEWFK